MAGVGHGFGSIPRLRPIWVGRPVVSVVAFGRRLNVAHRLRTLNVGQDGGGLVERRRVRQNRLWSASAVVAGDGWSSGWPGRREGAVKFGLERNGRFGTELGDGGDMRLVSLAGDPELVQRADGLAAAHGPRPAVQPRFGRLEG